jgi:glycosyltransferase involved in cell wall biosynthesis
MDLSIVVASFQNPQGLYLTVFAAIEQLSKTNLQWEIIIAADGGTTAKWEKLQNVRCLRIQSGSPQGTRNCGIRMAKAATVLVLEDHVVVSDIAAFLEAYKTIPSHWRPALFFPARIGESAEMFSAFGTETDWDGNLWFKRTLYSPQSRQPYMVPQFGHSCFIVDRDWYIESGGYTNLLIGYGGEETLLCFKAWMLGRECWQTPNIWHAHYLSDHGMGNAMASEQFKKNFKIVKYVLTGEYEGGPMSWDATEERSRIMKGPYGGDFQKLREYFRQQGIAH